MRRWGMETRRDIPPEDAIPSWLLTLHTTLCASWPSPLYTWNKIYFIAIELQRFGLLQKADQLFDVVKKHVTDNTDWLSWLYCKKGEISYDLGNRQEARLFFQKTLELQPGHVKATILETPETETLAVTIGERPPFALPALFVPVDINSESSWYYYFGRRKIDTLFITPPSKFMAIHPLLFKKIIEQYLTDTATIKCCLSADRFVKMDNGELRKTAKHGSAALSKTRRALWRQLGEMTCRSM